jgi:hypothetical protein
MPAGTSWRRWAGYTASGLVVAVSAVALVSARLAGAGGHVDGERQDCPHDWRGHPDPVDPTVPIAEIAVAPLISDIPEFHDCQKLIADDGNSYVSDPVAIFAHQTLLAQWDKLVGLRFPGTTVTFTPGPGGVLNFPPRGPGDPPRPVPVAVVGADAVVVAEILNYGPAYEPLGIRRGFNCLFVTLTADLKLRAAMVPVTEDSHCLTEAKFDTLPISKELTIKPTAGFPLDKYPQVARWDWDTKHNAQYIGIMCGAAWCEIGQDGFEPSPTFTGNPTRAIKGWYDRQRLAVPGPDGTLIPSNIFGTVFPNPNLGKYSATNFRKRWAPVATVILSADSAGVYSRKLNLEESSLASPNTIAVCYGFEKADCAPTTRNRLFDVPVPNLGVMPTCETRDESGRTWWAKIRAAKTGKEVYRCVSWWGVPPEAASAGFKVPGTARWRWLLNDETIWEACIQGCCQVETT